jgi:hypothetical protein
MNRTRARLWVFFAVIASASVSAHVSIPADFRAIVSESALIVRGRITDVRSIRVPSSGIETIATIVTEQVLKGQTGQFVSLRVPGGTVGSIRSVMTGAPELRTGDRAFFFLTRDPQAGFRLTGLSMGLYRLQGDGGRGRVTVRPPLVLMRNSPPGPIVRGDASRTSISVPEFESLVRLVSAQPQLPRVIRR